MGNIIIKVENLSKVYLTGQIGHGTFIRDFESWYAKVRRKIDPYRVAEAQTTHSAGKIWALKNVSFEVCSGEIIGLRGQNGAGKSTLLKILSRVTLPTSGKITGKGRLISLLEIGAGFHTELTGRENIFLNGAMLGMTRSDIRMHLDEIVDFAGISDYLDTPVKRYSSGMYVRLAFSAATHLNSQIIILDEVMAVGDTSFQQKCLLKIKNLSKNDGRSIIVVNHNTIHDSFFDREIKLVRGQIM